MMYTMPKNLLSICVNFTLATQRISEKKLPGACAPGKTVLIRSASPAIPFP